MVGAVLVNHTAEEGIDVSALRNPPVSIHSLDAIRRARIDDTVHATVIPDTPTEPPACPRKKESSRTR